jgi:thimet oligopeptidase
MSPTVKTIEDVIRFFPVQAEEIDSRAADAMKRARERVQEIIAIPDEQRTFDNTAKALDRAASAFYRENSFIQSLTFVSPLEQLRFAAQKTVLTLSEFYVDTFSQNKALYKAFKNYVEQRSFLERLNPEEHYYLEETLKHFKQAGLSLPDADQEELKLMRKELAKLEQDFELEISNDSTKRLITVTRPELEGLTEDFINDLGRSTDGRFVLGVDYPTYKRVLDDCAVESTRRALWENFVNRAYPPNESRLDAVIALRDRLARKLGYKSYADYDIDDQMAETPERVEQFLNEISGRAMPKAAKEFERYKADLPAGITLTPEGTVKPWDWHFIKAYYKKKHFDFDDRVIAQYFPLDKTLEGLFSIYQQFLDIKFKQLPVRAPWHEDVRVIQVTKADGTVAGYLFLDLFPRPHKYTHACFMPLIPALKNADGSVTPGAGIVIANFPKPTHDQPSLLMHDDVVTFFHEFGHALHGLLGATEMAGFSGTSVKRDFVEMPSQMLEEWMWDKEMIKRLSGHYQTGEKLPDNLIDTMIMLKNFDSGDLIVRQIILAKTSLDCFKAGEHKDVTALMHALQEKLRPYMATMPEDHFECSFGHLMEGYGSKYYGYLWSRVYALDLFDTIKREGLLNPVIGRKYRDIVLAQGGSRPPQELLRTFLGREPRSDAFFKDLGF